MHSSRAYPRARMCAATARAFDETARDQVEGVRRSSRPRSRRCRPAAGRRGPRRPAARWPRAASIGRGTGARPRARCARARGARAARRSVRAAAPGAPDRLDLGVDRLALARLQVAGQEGQLAVDHQARADLEDVGRLAQQARVLHHLRAPAARLDHDLDAGAVARLERARREQGERRPRRCGRATPPCRGACRRGRCRRSESPLARARSVAYGGRSTSSTWISRPSAVWNGGAWSSSRRPSARRRSRITPQHRVGHRARAPQRLVAVAALLEVDLGHRRSVPPSRSRACSSIEVSIA